MTLGKGNAVGAGGLARTAGAASQKRVVRTLSATASANQRSIEAGVQDFSDKTRLAAGLKGQSVNLPDFSVSAKNDGKEFSVINSGQLSAELSTKLQASITKRLPGQEFSFNKDENRDLGVSFAAAVASSHNPFATSMPGTVARTNTSMNGENSTSAWGRAGASAA